MVLSASPSLHLAVTPFATGPQVLDSHDGNSNDESGGDLDEATGEHTSDKEEDKGEFVRPWDDEGDDMEEFNQLWWDGDKEDGQGPAELADVLRDAEAIGADLVDEEDFYLDDVYAAEGFAPY